MERTGTLDRGDGVQLAWAHLPGRSPTVVFLPGFNSDMTGTKATELAALCAATGQAMLRFDYSGHGASGGAFTDGTIGRWAQDALAVIDRVADGPLLLVGSSMGGWIALLAALARPGSVTGLVGIAAAPDFTERLMWQAMSPTEQDTLTRQGRLEIPSEYGDPYTITMGLIEDGRRHLMLGAPIPLTCPVRLLHGQLDADVPWEQALTLAAQLTATDVQVTLIKDGDHRLSRPQDLALLRRTVATLLGQDGA
ncbi:alpha/beta hydrolase [Limobrevibacterium gyesilva]|uniref:Alpha/beta hydrolase n=1 Tax=Limobrevibacterium gyesilva TaxID=2991712 RepID=A0AA42CDH2_9PROT|nr:alpha/beta hydrolase [Limobrevibacterium gyesilva]MCW3474858.1 alpha/beta hydrolase [Limobrevibacterium gyesilva]